MERLLGHRFRRSTLVAVFCAAILMGTGLARVVTFDITWIIVSISFLLILPRRRWQYGPAFMVLLLLGISIGGFRGTAVMRQVAVYDGLYDSKIVLMGTAGEDSSYNKTKQVKFVLKDLYYIDELTEEKIPLVGKIGVSGFGENVIFRGDTVIVRGKLRDGIGSYQGWMSFAQLQLLERTDSNIEKVRREFGAGMQSALPEPLASFGMGLLIGQNTTLPDHVYKDLLMVGLVHIIAVSGYNLTIIVRACGRLLGNRSKYQTTIISAMLICTFLLLTGGSASIVRASIVSGLSLAAWYYGRNFKPVALILMAAAITCVWHPLYVWGDLGWYLSFLAFYGVMVLGPQVRFRMLPEKLRNNTLVLVAVESMCAEIMATPLILYVFGQTSLVSLLANVVIATVVPIAMLLSVMAGVAGMFFASVAGWIAWPAVMILTYMLDMAHILANIPDVFIENHHVNLLGMLFLYTVVLAMNLLLYFRIKQDPGIIMALNEEHTLLRTSKIYVSKD